MYVLTKSRHFAINLDNVEYFFVNLINKGNWAIYAHFNDGSETIVERGFQNADEAGKRLCDIIDEANTHDC